MNAITKIQTTSTMARIGAHMIWEWMTDPHPKRLESIPRSVDAITAEWLNDALCRQHPGAKVVAFDFGAINVGTTSRRSINVTYNEAGQQAKLPQRLFGKATPHFGSRLLCGLSNAIENEVHFYNLVRPQLNMETLTSYFSAFDPGSYRSIFLFDDIAATRGAKFLNAHHEFSRAEAAGMMAVMAKYHGTFWNSPKLTKEFVWLRDALTNQYHINRYIAFQERTAVGVERTIGILPARIQARATELWPIMIRSCELRVAGPRTLVHADSHAGNWYKTGGGQMGICDWQCTVTGDGITDVAYALSSSLTIENRRAWEQELFQVYLDALRAEIGDQAPNFETGWLAYRRQMMHGLFNWFFVAGAGALQPSMQPDDLFRINLERMATAVDDLGTLDSMGG